MRFTRILALLLAFELFISSMGIAQVSHVCKMAMNAGQSSMVELPVSDVHECCEEVLVDICHTRKENSCCTNQIRYFHNSFNSTFHELSGLIIFKVATLHLFNYDIFFHNEIFDSFLSFLTDKYPPGEYGRDLLTSIQTYLI